MSRLARAWWSIRNAVLALLHTLRITREHGVTERAEELQEEESAPATKATAGRERRPRGKKYEHFGQFRNLKDLLLNVDPTFDDLDGAIRCRGVRWHGDEASHLMRTAGPFLTPAHDYSDTEANKEESIKTVDGFGGVFPGFFLTCQRIDDALRRYLKPGQRLEYWTGKAVKLTKSMAWPNWCYLIRCDGVRVGVESRGPAWVTYEYGIGYKFASGSKRLQWHITYMAVHAQTREVVELKSMMSIPVTVGFSKRRKADYGGRRSSTTYTRRVWGVPPVNENVPPQERPEHVVRSFRCDFNRAMLREAHWSVVVRRRSGHRSSRITFGITQNDAPYFFRQRFKIKTPNGRTKPIFHAVRAHFRSLSSGAVATVRTHYRGLTTFVWRGDQVSVYIPGHNGRVLLNEFDVGGRHENEITAQEREDSTTLANVAGEMSNWAETGDRPEFEKRATKH